MISGEDQERAYQIATSHQQKKLCVCCCIFFRSSCCRHLQDLLKISRGRPVRFSWSMETLAGEKTPPCRPTCGYMQSHMLFSIPETAPETPDSRNTTILDFQLPKLSLRCLLFHVHMHILLSCSLLFFLYFARSIGHEGNPMCLVLLCSSCAMAVDSFS